MWTQNIQPFQIIRSDEGLTYETSAPPFYLTVPSITRLINSFDYPNLKLEESEASYRIEMQHLECSNRTKMFKYTCSE